MRHLPLRRVYEDLRIDKARRPDDLLDHFAAGPLQLVLARRGRNEDDLVPHRLEFLEAQRPIIQRAGQPEAMLHQRLLALAVSVEHGSDLRDRHVRFVDDQQEILREIVDQRVRFLPGFSAIKMARVILDSRAIPHLLDHLHVILRPRQQPLRLQQLSLSAKLHHALIEFLLDRLNGRLHAVLGHDVVDGRVDEDERFIFNELARERVDDLDGDDLVAEELDVIGELLVAGMQLDDIAAHAEGAALEVDVVVRVLEIDELVEHGVAVDLLAAAQRKHRRLIRLRRAQAENTGDGRDQKHVAAADEIAGGREAQAIEVVVARGILLDVDVALRDVGLGLVIVVIADEVTDGIVGEQPLELLVKLGGQCLVVADNESRPVQAGHGLGHRVGLARAGDAHEDLEPLAIAQRAGQLIDRLRLIALRREG